MGVKFLLGTMGIRGGYYNDPYSNGLELETLM